MNSRERIKLALDFKEADRVAIQDSPWETAIERWHKEGLPEDKAPEEYFDYEIATFGADTTFQLPEETVEETEKYTIVKNACGALVKNWKHATSTPEMIDFTIKDKKTWDEHRPLLAMNDSRINWEKDLPAYKAAKEKGKFVVYGAAMGYDKTQGIVGSEDLLIAMAEDPEWVKDMFSSSADLIIQTAEEMLSKSFEFDGAFIFDDMGYRNSSLFSPAMHRELLMPYQKRVFDFFKSKGLKTILHSCGRVSGLIPQLIEAGLSCLQPLEVKAGMDLLELKKQYGDKLCFMGGIDVRKMADDNPEVIEEELRTKVGTAKKGGGYIYHSDHSVPDNVSFEQYKRVIELVLKYGNYNR